MGKPAATRRRNDSSVDAAHRLIAAGTATSRAEVATELGVSASTASLLVKALVAEGLVHEVGVGESTGGRRPTRLQATTPVGTIAVAELGGSHVRYGLCDLAGQILCRDEFRIDIAEGPDRVLAALAARWDDLVGPTDGRPPLAAALALPGPVNAHTGEVVGPSRMPGWHGVRPVEVLARLYGVPATVENDARAAALGEFVARGQQADEMIYVKAGTGIGAGMVAGGRLFTGANGVAGDIAHVRVTDEPTLCTCGRVGCLEAVASGAAIRSQLDADGVPTADVRDLVDRGQELQPEVSSALRTAGDRLGRALAPLVNFLNPRMVIVGGALSGTDSFVAAVRSALYDYCLPMCTQELTIEAAMAGPDAALRGLGRLGSDLTTSQHPTQEYP